MLTVLFCFIFFFADFYLCYLHIIGIARAYTKIFFNILMFFIFFLIIFDVSL